MARDQSYYARGVRDIFPDAQSITDHRSTFQIIIFLDRPTGMNANPVTLLQIDTLAELLGTRAISLQPFGSFDDTNEHRRLRGHLVITVSNVCWPGAESGR